MILKKSKNKKRDEKVVNNEQKEQMKGEQSNRETISR